MIASEQLSFRGIARTSLGVAVANTALFDATFHQIVPPVSSPTRNDDPPTYHAAVVFKPTPDGSIYFDYGTSFDPCAESLSLSVATASVAPEKIVIYETGTKSNVLRGDEQRTLLFDFDTALQQLSRGVFHNLLRAWADV